MTLCVLCDVTTFVLGSNAYKWLERVRHESISIKRSSATSIIYIYKDMLLSNYIRMTFWDNVHDDLFVLIVWDVILRHTKHYIHTHTHTVIHNQCASNYVQRFRQSQYHQRSMLCKQDAKEEHKSMSTQMVCAMIAWNEI